MLTSGPVQASLVGMAPRFAPGLRRLLLLVGPVVLMAFGPVDQDWLRMWTAVQAHRPARLAFGESNRSGRGTRHPPSSCTGR